MTLARIDAEIMRNVMCSIDVTTGRHRRSASARGRKRALYAGWSAKGVRPRMFTAAAAFAAAAVFEANQRDQNWTWLDYLVEPKS